tara:strand:+ start:438 stop:842 length:405 start_codon:yes stop_codon:yes gene_type:complete
MNIKIINKIYFSNFKRTLMFSLIIILVSSCLGNFNHNTKEKIIDDYYIIATDIKSQANISIYKKNYESYIGITPEGITEYSIINKEFIIGKNKTNNYFIIKIGEETCEKVNSAKFEKLLISKNINVEKVKWEKI